MSSLLKLLSLPKLQNPVTSFEGKTIIVTGSNVGLGFEATIKFVTLGAAKVIMAVRSIEKGIKAKHEIESLTKKTEVIELWQLDMTSYDSIRAFAKRVTEELGQIDIAILNAGVHMACFEQSQYGWESSLQVNTLSTFLLGALLLPKLKTSKAGHGRPVLEIVSSGHHQRGRIDPKHLESENILASYNTSNGYRGRFQYGISKQLEQFGMLKLAALASSEDGTPEVIVTSVCPGPCKSQLARGYSGFVYTVVMSIMYAFFFRTAEMGARTLVSGTTLGEQSHGQFWQHDKLSQPLSQYSREEVLELEKRMTFELTDALRKDVPEIVEYMSSK